MAVSLPNGGETNFNKVPENKYHRTIAMGPCHPTNSDNFLENSNISKVGLLKLEYIVERELAHF
jgi:hypothetical protein